MRISAWSSAVCASDLRSTGSDMAPARPTLSDFIDLPSVYPAGRLDLDSEGLLLLTDDGRLQARSADPWFKMPKSYLVQVEGEPTEARLHSLRRGVRLKDGLTRPAEVECIAAATLWPPNPPIRLTKARNRGLRGRSGSTRLDI